MAHTLHLDPEAMRQVTRDLQRFTEEMRHLTQETTSRIYHLEWVGGARDEFVERVTAWQQQANLVLEQVEALQARLTKEIEEWLAADATFATLSTGAVPPGPMCPVSWPKNAPRNMQELAKRIPNGKVEIIRIRENEYVVLVPGTKLLSEEGGWIYPWSKGGHRLTKGEASQLAEITQRLIQETIPPGAKVHLVGYSQGGMVAQWLGPQLQKTYDIQSVTSFGAAVYNRKVKGVEYNIFIEKEDFIARMITKGEAFSLNDKQIKWIDDKAKWWHPKDTHVYLDNENLSSYEAPFIPEEFTVVGSHELGPTIPQKLTSNTWEEIQKRVQIGSDALETARNATEDAIDRASEFTQDIHEQAQEITHEATEFLDDMKKGIEAMSPKLPKL